MSLITVDSQRCIKCGRCAAVCPRGLIRLEAEGPSETCENAAELCVVCGHCVAVCPVTALDNSRTPLSSQPEISAAGITDPVLAAQFLRSRRSIRLYKKQPVPREKLLQLADIARFAPTGSNSQGISYRVIESPATLHHITAETVAWLEKQASAGSPTGKAYAQYAQIYRQTGRDVILRDAPCVMLGLALKTFPRGRENTHFSFAYAELYAPSLGLGTCWAGLFQAAAFDGFEPLLKLLDLPEDKALTGALMVGIPEFGYYRLPDRNPLEITFDSDN